jgi:hypothetical protein
MGAELIVITNHWLAEFFRKARRRVDPASSPGAPTKEDIQSIEQAAAEYGYMLMSPEESAATTKTP